MENLIEILKIALTGLLVFATAFAIMYLFIKNERERRKMELLLNNRNQLLPARLQAYERMTLFLERITPESMVIREQSYGLTAGQLHAKLLGLIRHEYEHNLAMQIYINTQTWEKIKLAKEEIVKLLNTTIGEVPPQVPALELGRRLIEYHPNKTAFTVRHALDAINNDVLQMME